jgi:hypothetical protein
MRKVAHFILVTAAALALAIPAAAQQQTAQPQADHQAAPPLVQLLQSKGILTAAEVAEISSASSAEEANARLAQVLVKKGLITQDEVSRTIAPSTAPSTVSTGNGAPTGGELVDAAIHVPAKAKSEVPASSDAYTYGPTSQDGVIPAVAPTRVLPIDIPKQAGMIPDIKLGSGANMKLYGFFKASAVEQTASSGGAQFADQDFPLPLLQGDTGPNGNPYFLIKARSFRIGSQFEWVPQNSDLVITGKLETDFEGDYTSVNNRSISAARSNQLSLRLAYVRLDKHVGGIPVYAEFGQDWSLAGSSTLPNIFETTGLMVGYGDVYERIPQFKAGAQLGSGRLKFEPDFAIVWPVSADSSLVQLQRTGTGDLAGAASNTPGVEGRLVFQYVLNPNWQGVAPAQLIFSGHHSTNREVVTEAAAATTGPVNITTNGGSSGLPNTLVTGATGCSVELPTGGCSIKGFYPRGVAPSDPENMWTAELQLPTPWVTFDTKYYHGTNIRWFFGGLLNADYASPGPGLVEAGSATSISGQTILFGCASGAANTPATTCNGPVTVGSLNSIRGQGGFAEMSFPLSRIFHADPGGRNAGWVFHVLYGTDRAKASDARASEVFPVAIGGNGLVRTDYYTGSLSYKINRWVSFVNEVTYLDTMAATDGSKLFAGQDATKAHAIREEFGTVITF